MSAEERKKILQMVEEGKISAEQAASLMKALEVEPTESDIEVIEAIGIAAADVLAHRLPSLSAKRHQQLA